MNESSRENAGSIASAKADPNPPGRLLVPARYALSGKIHSNAIRQLAERQSEGELGAKRFGVKGKFEGRAIQREGGGDLLAVRRISSAPVISPNILLIGDGDVNSPTWPSPDNAKSAKWLKPTPVAPAAEDLAAVRRLGKLAP